MSEADLEGRYRVLQNERATIVTRLKRLNYKNTEKTDKQDADLDEQIQTVPSKRKRSPTAPFTLVTERPPVMEDPESLRRRNKKMFHSMLGHLQCARDTLAKDKAALETQSKRTQKVTEELKKQEDDRRELVREELNKKRLIELERKDTLDEEIAQVELRLLDQSLNKQFDRRSHFLMTKTEPKVYWAPAIFDSKLSPVYADSITAVQSRRTVWADTVEKEKKSIAEFFARKRKERAQQTSSS